MGKACIWKELPATIRESNTLNTFKDHRTHIFEIQGTRFLKLILQKIDLSKLL